MRFCRAEGAAEKHLNPQARMLAVLHRRSKLGFSTAKSLSPSLSRGTVHPSTVLVDGPHGVGSLR